MAKSRFHIANRVSKSLSIDHSNYSEYSRLKITYNSVVKSRISVINSGSSRATKNNFLNSYFTENKMSWSRITRIETLRLRFFGSDRRTSRNHVTSALAPGLQFEVHVCTTRPRCRSDLPQGFLHPKTSQPHVWEKILLVKIISLINYRILFHRNVIIVKTISQLKQKWTHEWKEKWQPAIC